VKEVSQGTGLDTDSPPSSSAAADTMVKAVPGISFAFSGPPAGRAPDRWRWPTARTLPVEAWTATISPEYGTPSSAVSAAFCTVELIVVCTGVPDVPGHSARTPIVTPAGFTATTSVVG